MCVLRSQLTWELRSIRLCQGGSPLSCWVTRLITPAQRLVLLRGVLGSTSGYRGYPVFLSDTELAGTGTPDSFTFFWRNRHWFWWKQSLIWASTITCSRWFISCLAELCWVDFWWWLSYFWSKRAFKELTIPRIFIFQVTEARSMWEGILDCSTGSRWGLWASALFPGTEDGSWACMATPGVRLLSESP